MAQATPFETPRACPFVALELDRDKRSDQPDYRHRCFAEPTPAPRSIAHQEAYCLSPNFSACPVFQDWAVRAAAHPVPGSGSNGGTAAAGAADAAGAAAVGAAAVAAVDNDRDIADVDAETPAPEPETAPAATNSVIEELPEDASVTPAGADIAAAAAAATGIAAGVASSPPTFATTDWQSEVDESEQLAAFDAPVAHPFDEPIEEPRSSYGAPDAGYPVAADDPAPMPAPFVPPPTQAIQPPADHDDAAAVAAPAFLAGRSSRPAAATGSAATGAPPPARPPAREDLVPSWEIDGRYGAEGPPEGSGGGGRMDGVLTAIAVIAILALGIAAVLFLPGLLNNKTPARTTSPSQVVSSTPPSAAPTAHASIPATVGPSVPATIPPTTPASVGPVGSPHFYTIKSGDTLARVARKFDTTVEAILAANPGIANADDIQAGQQIVIPPPTP